MAMAREVFRCIRTTISFNGKASTVLATVQPKNVSEFVSRAVIAYAQNEPAVLRAEFNYHMDEARRLCPPEYKGKSIYLKE